MELKWFDGIGCKVAVVEASKNMNTGKEIYTYCLRYWRAIHAEVMTHRVFSRNASSSRAIPVAKLIADVRNNPAMPIFVGKNQPGMQAREEVDAETRAKFDAEWLELANINADFAERWAIEYNIHKQVANRVLEPFGWITVVLTSTEWDNWYALRDHKDAQPEIQDLAQTMRKARAATQPRHISHFTLQDARSWHLPFVTMEERRKYPVLELLQMSTARCARTSYNNHDQSAPDVLKDIKLHDDLVVAEPIHASPSEHQACAVDDMMPSGNFQGGWGQYRKVLEKHGWKNVQDRFGALMRQEANIMLQKPGQGDLMR